MCVCTQFIVPGTVFIRRSFDLSRIFFITCDFPPLKEARDSNAPFPDFDFDVPDCRSYQLSKFFISSTQLYTQYLLTSLILRFIASSGVRAEDFSSHDCLCEVLPATGFPLFPVFLPIRVITRSAFIPELMVPRVMVPRGRVAYALPSFLAFCPSVIRDLW